jgi:hypothetical protein
MKLWIARDETGQLWLFDKPPVLRDKNAENTEYSWFDMSEDGLWNYRINDGDFQEVTFENSPQEVELKLIE